MELDSYKRNRPQYFVQLSFACQVPPIANLNFFAKRRVNTSFSFSRNFPVFTFLDIFTVQIATLIYRIPSPTPPPPPPHSIPGVDCQGFFHESLRISSGEILPQLGRKLRLLTVGNRKLKQFSYSEGMFTYQITDRISQKDQ
jgi:hypothetical protein